MLKDKISIIYPYYNSPQMFQRHQEEWRKYPKEWWNNLEFIIVDDCSEPQRALYHDCTPFNFPIKIYRIHKNVNWNWRSARNIGAYEAKNSWLFLTDMDLLIPKETISELLKMGLDEKYYYTFDRILINGEKYKDHPNSYLISKNSYLKIGGYDEIVSGLYGLDGIFKKRIKKVASEVHLDGINIIHYSREDIKDASVSTLKRKEDRETPEFKKGKELLHKRFRDNIPPLILSFPYKRVK